jgi:hypothetical protein
LDGTILVLAAAVRNTNNVTVKIYKREPPSGGFFLPKDQPAKLRRSGPFIELLKLGTAPSELPQILHLKTPLEAFAILFKLFKHVNPMEIIVKQIK